MGTRKTADRSIAFAAMGQCFSASHAIAPVVDKQPAAALELRQSESMEAGAARAAARPLGISLEGMRALVAQHGGRAAFAGKSTAWVKLNVVLPATLAAESSYVATLAAAGSPHAALATAFISHAYDDEFLGVVDAVAALEAREGASAFYYFDLLVVNQHGQGAVVPFEALRGEFGRSVRAIGRTLLVLRWANPVPLQRAWCVFELATTLTVGASMKVLMPPADAAAFKEALLHDFDSLTYKTCRVDVEKAGAREKADLDNIQRVIRESDGYLKTNQLVIGAMKSWMVEEGRAALSSADGKVKSSLMSRLAHLLRYQGKLDEAEPLYFEALAAYRRALGNEHPDTLHSINNLAVLLKDKGKLDEAEPLYLEALAAQRRTLGNEHPDTLSSINGLAVLLSAQGKLGEAEPLYLEALAARRRTLGNEHPNTLQSISNLAILLKNKGNLGEAKPLYLEALAAYRRTLGNEHPDTLNSINNLANLLSGQGKLGEAEPLYLEALAASRRTLGNEHPNTLNSINNLGSLLCIQGKLDEAEPLYLEALAAYRRTLGNEHPDTLRSINNLAGLLLDQSKLDEAEPLYLEALAAFRRTLGSEHPDTLSCIYNYAGLLMKQGKRKEALKQYRLELEGVRRVHGEDHPSTKQSLRNYERLVGGK